MEFFDSHSHYNDEKFDEDREEIINKTYEDGITKFVCAGYDIESSKKSIEICNKYPFIYSICGVSPNDVPESLEEVESYVKQIEEIIKEDKYNLPIVIHTREAVEDTITMLKENNVINKGVFHCCPLNRQLVHDALKLGFYISFAGPITFKNSKNAEEIVKMVPLDKVLIETDSPYLAPEPKRGTRNDSRNVKLVAQKVADFKNIKIEEVAKASYENAYKIFTKIMKK